MKNEELKLNSAFAERNSSFIIQNGGLSLAAGLLIIAVFAVAILISLVCIAGYGLTAIPCAVFMRERISCVVALISCLSFRTNKAPLTVTDKVLPSCTLERFSDKRGVLGTVILQKSSLQLLFVIIAADVDLLLREGIDARIIHHGGHGSRSGIEVLHLLGREVPCLEH